MQTSSPCFNEANRQEREGNNGRKAKRQNEKMTTLSTHKKWHNTIPCDTCKTAEGWWQMWTNLNERKFEWIYAHKSTQPIHKMCKTFMRENIHTQIRAPSTFHPIFLFKFKWTPTYTRFACFNGYFFLLVLCVFILFCNAYDWEREWLK